MISARSLSADRFPSAMLVALLATTLIANVVIAQLIAQGRITLLVYLAVCAAFPLSFLLWRQAMYAVFVVLFVEGYFRNLLNTPGVLLVKDLMLAAIGLMGAGIVSLLAYAVSGAWMIRQAARAVGMPVFALLLPDREELGRLARLTWAQGTSLRTLVGTAADDRKGLD